MHFRLKVITKRFFNNYQKNYHNSEGSKDEEKVEEEEDKEHRRRGEHGEGNGGFSDLCQ